MGTNKSESSGLNELDNKDKNINESSSTKSDGGLWHDIARKDMSYGGVMYPVNWEFQVKAGNVKDVRHWSSIDETNPISVNNHMNDLMNTNVRIIDTTGERRKVVSSDKIFEMDRFQFILFVHTYSGMTTKLTYKATCGETDSCKAPQDVTLTPFNLQYSELSVRALEYMTAEDGIVFETKSHGKVSYKPITIEWSKKFSDFNKKALQSGDEIEQNFIRLLPFLMDDVSTIQTLYQKYLGIGEKLFGFYMQTLKKHLDIRALGEISFKCTTCDQEGIAPVKFPNGLANLFFADDVDDEFI